MLVISVSVAAIITAVLHQSITGITITPEILLRAMRTMRDAVLSALIALSAGAAASLALVTQPHIVETSWGASQSTQSSAWRSRSRLSRRPR
jgi:hypothetical protein